MKLAPVTPDLFLFFQLEQDLEPLLNRCTFCLETGQFQYLFHEFVVNNDIGSHKDINVYELYKSYTQRPSNPTVARPESCAKRKPC